ncbi:MAG TPA: NADH-quinone oxidoreductase subunit C [Streptosporangiaceae bacterium]
MTPDEIAAAWSGWSAGPAPSGDAGDPARVDETFGTLTVDVPAGRWVDALRFARDDLGCGFFDWLTGVDELADGLGVVAHVYSLESGHHLLVRTRVPRAEPVLATATGVYRGANWHERETYEMFGVIFDGHPDLKPLLLPDGFEGHPLRKDFVLAARVAKPWPGALEPGESGAGAPSRRRLRPPGVPADWGRSGR